MESYAKYAEMPRVHTCLLIDEPAVVLLGRTYGELVTTIVAFVAFAYFDMGLVGVVVALLTGWLIPLVRIRFPRGYAWHVAWSLGVWFPEAAMFTARRMTRVLGP